MHKPGNRELVDFHVRSAVAAARRKGAIITFSRFLARLRARNPAIEIDQSYVLDRLVRGAKENNVPVEIDTTEGGSGERP